MRGLLLVTVDLLADSHQYATVANIDN